MFGMRGFPFWKHTNSTIPQRLAMTLTVLGCLGTCALSVGVRNDGDVSQSQARFTAVGSRQCPMPARFFVFANIPINCADCVQCHIEC